ncbi:MAG: hypothetical protein KC649_04065 [Candidatus Omnitrophica bacterium]|nr:hypothetical protein [Candidatus Omnitrophota bacterium]
MKRTTPSPLPHKAIIGNTFLVILGLIIYQPFVVADTASQRVSIKIRPKMLFRMNISSFSVNKDQSAPTFDQTDSASINTSLIGLDRGDMIQKVGKIIRQMELRSNNLNFDMLLSDNPEIAIQHLQNREIDLPLYRFNSNSGNTPVMTGSVSIIKISEKEALLQVSISEV